MAGVYNAIMLMKKHDNEMYIIIMKYYIIQEKIIFIYHNTKSKINSLNRYIKNKKHNMIKYCCFLVIIL